MGAFVLTMVVQKAKHAAGRLPAALKQVEKKRNENPRGGGALKYALTNPPLFFFRVHQQSNRRWRCAEDRCTTY